MKPLARVQWKKQHLIGIIWVPAKKLFLWFQKGETGRTLTRTCGTFSNFHLFTTILNKIVIFFLQFLYFFALIWTKFFLFHPIISDFVNLGWNRGQFQTSFTETVRGFKKLSQFQRNWSQKKALFLFLFSIKLAKRPVSRKTGQFHAKR